MTNLWQVRGNDLHLRLHRGQLAAWDSDRRFVFMIAGTQGGKTSFGPWWLQREITRGGRGDYLAVTASFDLFKLKMLPEMRLVFERILRIGRYWASSKVLEIGEPGRGFWAKRSDDPMWARVILRSAEAKAGLEAATAKAAWLDECGQDGFALETWEAVQRRLSLAQGRVLGTTTPYNLGWLKTEINDRWRDGDPDIDVVRFASTTNPAFPQAEYDRVERKMQAWRFRMFYRGEFTKPAGLIYNAFTDDMLCDAFPIPPEWLRVMGVDFGGVNTATLWMAQDPSTDIWHVYRETLSGDRTSREHAESASEHADGLDEVLCYGGAKSEGQQRRDWGDGGFYIGEPPISDVEAGIDRVVELMKSGRFRVFRTLRGLRDELGTYRRKLDDSGEPTETIVDKRKFHRLDALRYAAAGIEDSGPWAWVI